MLPLELFKIIRVQKKKKKKEDEARSYLVAVVSLQVSHLHQCLEATPDQQKRAQK